MQLKVSKYAETNTHQCKYQRLRILTLSESTETRSHRATTSRSEACNPNTETDPPRLTHFLISYGSLNRKAYLSLSLSLSPLPSLCEYEITFPKIRQAINEDDVSLRGVVATILVVSFRRLHSCKITDSYGFTESLCRL